MAKQDIFRRPMVEILALYVLSKQDMYTYQIIQEIKQLTNGEFSLTDGILYPVMRKLSSDGYLSEREEAVNRRIRIYYHLEDAGKDYFNECWAAYKRMADIFSNVMESEQQ